MEVRLLSVGTRGYFLASSRLAIAALPLNFVAPNEKKPLAPGYASWRKLMQISEQVNNIAQITAQK